ncbi:MAG: hypothetical protein QM781_16165 [Chitinophagaceae bacterium]
MKRTFLLSALSALVLASCSTAYKTGQTPDDVYFSPAADKEEYVVADKRDDRYYGGTDYYEDRYLRMRVTDRYRWSAFDDYYNNPYAYSPYSYYPSWNSPWNSYWAWNNFYNPYCGWNFGGGYGYGHGGGIVIIKDPVRYNPPSRSLVLNPASYNIRTNSNANGSYAPGRNNNYTGPRYNNSNANSGLGGTIRRTFSGSNNNSNNSYNGSHNNNNSTSTPTRSYNPSSSSSSSSSGSRSSSSSSSSGGGVSRPIR